MTALGCWPQAFSFSFESRSSRPMSSPRWLRWLATAPRAPEKLRDRAGAPETADRARIVAEHARDDFVGVLARRGYRADAARRLRHLDRDTRQVHLAGHRIVRLHQHLTVPQVRITGDLRDRAHRADRDAGLSKRRADLFDRMRRAPRVDPRAARVGAGASDQRRVVALAGAAVDQLHQARGHLARAGADDH